MWASQVVAVTRLNLRSLRSRLPSSMVTVVGVAGVVAILVAVLSIGQGFGATLEGTGSPDNAVVVRAGSTGEMVSFLTLDAGRIIADAPGVLRTDRGPLASAEAYVIVDLPKKSTGTVANVPLRGVDSTAFELRDGMKIVEGRRFRPGTQEIIAGVGAARTFEGLTLGSKHRWGDHEWTVVGLFTADGGVTESELWCDVRVLQPAYRRGSMIQSLYARLDSPAAFDRFESALAKDPRVNVTVTRESEYYAGQGRILTTLVAILGALIALPMGIGAAFTALLTMYSSVSSRSREIATLRALGFRAGPVVLSVLAESLALGLIGGCLGGAGAYLLFNGFEASTINWQSFSQVAFTFQVTPALLGRGILYALVIGLLGGLLPALRAARLPVVEALRAL